MMLVGRCCKSSVARELEPEPIPFKQGALQVKRCLCFVFCEKDKTQCENVVAGLDASKVYSEVRAHAEVSIRLTRCRASVHCS